LSLQALLDQGHTFHREGADRAEQHCGVAGVTTSMHLAVVARAGRSSLQEDSISFLAEPEDGSAVAAIQALQLNPAP